MCTLDMTGSLGVWGRWEKYTPRNIKGIFPCLVNIHLKQIMPYSYILSTRGFNAMLIKYSRYQQLRLNIVVFSISKPFISAFSIFKVNPCHNEVSDPYIHLGLVLLL